MENKIQELADKIYQEGVEKGNAEARKLVQQAREEAEAVVADARKQASFPSSGVRSGKLVTKQ